MDGTFPIYMDPDRVGTKKAMERVLEERKFPIYMDPDRVGTRMTNGRYEGTSQVSNLYGSRQSRDVLVCAAGPSAPLFPIYMDPDRVGTPFRYLLVMEDECMFPIYMDPDRVGTPEPNSVGLPPIQFPIYMDPDRVGTVAVPAIGSIIKICFQFIWIPTESGPY